MLYSLIETDYFFQTFVALVRESFNLTSNSAENQVNEAEKCSARYSHFEMNWKTSEVFSKATCHWVNKDALMTQ